jgi:hypothetical protein
MKIINSVFGSAFGLFSGLIVALLFISNLLLVTSVNFHDRAANLLSNIPFADLLENSPSKRQRELEIENKNLRERNSRYEKVERQRVLKVDHARKLSRQIAQRSIKNATYNVASMVGEATPYLGIGLVVAATAMDVKDNCDTIKDVNAILEILDDNAELVDENTVCGIQVPNVPELVARIKANIGGTVDESMNRLSEGSKCSGQLIPDSILSFSSATTGGMPSLNV